MPVHLLFPLEENMQNKFQNSTCLWKTAITGEIRNRKLFPQMNLYFLETFSLNLSYMLFAFITFPLTLASSHNIRVNCNQSVCCCEDLCHVSNILCDGIWLLWHYMLYHFFPFLKLDLYICCIPLDQLPF